MKLADFITGVRDDERAVSPVIGVILMVAITVILAAVIGAFVLQTTDSLQDTAPRASFSFDADDAGNVAITHESGAEISEADITIKYTDGTTDYEEAWTGADTDSADSITAGDTHNTANAVADGTTVRVIWTSDSGQTTTLGKFDK